MTRTMTRDEALKKSITHWKENRESYPSALIIAGNKCALCTKYYTGNLTCPKCPLTEIGQTCDDTSSVWKEVHNAVTDYDKEGSQKEIPTRWQRACTNMISALENCLNATE